MKLILKIVGGLILSAACFAVAVFLTFSQATVPTKGPRIDGYAEPQKAVLVIDVQEDFIGKSAHPSRQYKNSDNIIEAMNRVIEEARVRNYRVVYIRQEYEGIWAQFLSKTLFGGRGLPGRPGTQIDKRVMMVSEDIFTKRIGDAFSNPALSDFLIANQVDELLLVGLDVQYCVHATAQGALNRGYKVSVATDAVAILNEKKWDPMMEKYEREGIVLTNSKSF